MMKNEAKVNEAVENEVLEGEVIDGDEVETKKTKQAKGFFAKNKKKIFGGAALFAGGFLLKTLIGMMGSKGDCESCDEPAYLPSGEGTEE